MAKDDFGALLAAGLLGFGLGMIAASSSRDRNQRRREQFRQAIRQALSDRGINLVSATLGRGAANRAFWDLTVQWPYGEISTVRVTLQASIDPYSQDALTALISKLPVEQQYSHG